MSRGETAPSVVQDVVVLLGADGVVHEGAARSPLCGFAAGEEVRARAADGVLDQVGDEEGEEEGDGPAEDGDVDLVGAGADEEGPEEEDGERDGAGVDEEPDWTFRCQYERALTCMRREGKGWRKSSHTDRDTLHLRMGELYVHIIQREHAMKRLNKEGQLSRTSTSAMLA